MLKTDTTVSSHRFFTPFLHTVSSHRFFTSFLHTVSSLCLHCVFTVSLLCHHRFFTPCHHTVSPHRCLHRVQTLVLYRPLQRFILEQRRHQGRGKAAVMVQCAARVYVKLVFIIHVGGTRCVTSSTDNIMKIRARITLTVEFIRGYIFIFLFYV